MLQGDAEGDRAEEPADAIGGEIIEGMSQRIVIEVLRRNGSIQKAFDRLAREELRREVEAPVGESQAVEDEGDHGAAGADDARIMHGKKSDRCVRRS